MLGAWPGKCNEDCEDPGNDGDGEGTLPFWRSFEITSEVSDTSMINSEVLN